MIIIPILLIWKLKYRKDDSIVYLALEAVS